RHRGRPCRDRTGGRGTARRRRPAGPPASRRSRRRACRSRSSPAGASMLRRWTNLTGAATRWENSGHHGLCLHGSLHVTSTAFHRQRGRCLPPVDGPAMSTMFAADLPGLELLHRGKVRDVFAVDGETLLIVATDRLSAFDVVLPDPIPRKGEILTQTARFWFERTRALVPNHLLERPLESVLPAGADADAYRLRSSVTRRLRPLPIEAVARGYLIGSGWKDYQASGAVCGIPLPAG